MSARTVRTHTVRTNLNGARILAAAGLALSLGAPALAQMPANVQTQLRPFVTIQVPGNGNVGQGIFDTGSPAIFISPETNVRLALARSPGDADARYFRLFTNFNQNGNVGGEITVRTNFTLGGYLGGSFTGPELGTGGAGTPPSHVYTAANNLNRTDPQTTNGLAAARTYYNARFSDNILGMSFAVPSGGGSGWGAFIDPTNASVSAFPFSLRDPNVGEPTDGVNYIDLNGSGTYNANGILINDNSNTDNRTSSVSFFDPNSGRMVTFNRNFNPAFVTPYQLTARDFMTGNNVAAGFSRQNFNDGNGDPNGATLGQRPYITISGPNTMGLPNGTYLVDTGAPTTNSVPANGTVIIGTDRLNQWGQYWDFSNNPQNNGRATLILVGPTNPDTVNLLGPGMLMNVDRTAVGLTRTAVNQLRQFGIQDDMRAGMAPDVSPVNGPNQQGSAIFRTHMSGSNAAYVSGMSAYGAGPNDQMMGLSIGQDQIGPVGGARPGAVVAAPAGPVEVSSIGARGSRVFFSVDAQSQGLNDNVNEFGGGVVLQAALGQHMGDVFESHTARPRNTDFAGNAAIGNNGLRFNQDVMGLGSNVGPMFPANPAFGNPDNLRDFDLQPQRGMLNNAQIMRNTDPTIRQSGDVRNPEGAVSGAPARTDVLGTSFSTYFAAQIPGGGSNILSENAGGPGAMVFAPFNTMGLNINDQIDALAMQRYSMGALAAQGLVIGPGQAAALGEILIGNYWTNSLEEFGTITFGADLVVFSLERGAPSLGIFDPSLNRMLSPADLFISDFDGTFTLFASAESLGLNPFTDNIDGLDLVAPAPGAAVVLGLGGVLAARRRRSTVC